MNATQTQKLTGLRKVEKFLSPVGLVLAVASAVLIYMRSSSIWFAIFGFIMVSRFMIGSVPKIIFHSRKIYRTLFYLLWPVGGTLILYLIYQLWEIEWLAVVLGIIGGMFFSVLVGYFFFQDVATKDQQRESAVADYMVEEKLAKHPDAVAMKGRFSNSEWDEIKLYPWMVCGLVMMMGDKPGKADAYALAETLTEPEGIEDPLLRMMLLDLSSEIHRSMGHMDSLTQVASALSGKVTDHSLEQLAQSGQLSAKFEGVFNVSPKALHTIQSNLNPDESRSFFKSLVGLGFKVASTGNQATKAQIEAIFNFVPVESKADLFAMLGL